MTEPGVPVRVTPQAFHDAGLRFAAAQDRIDEITGRLRARLAGLLGAAGDDTAAREFDRSYTPAADGAFRGLSRLTGQVGAIGRGLGVSAENHRRGDADSAPATATGAPFPPIPARAEPFPAGAPAVVGHPAYWVPDWAERYWPDGDPSRLRDVASAWYAAADEVTRLGADLHTVLVGLVRANDGDDVRALAAYWDRVGTSGTALFVTVPGVCTALGDGCIRLADAVEDAHRTMLDVIGEVALGAVLVGVGIALTAPTLGGSDVVAGGAGAGAIAGAVAELDVLAGTLLAAVGSGLAIAGVASAGDALRFAVENSPDPRQSEVETTKIGDGLGRGTVDESARRFTPEERRIADRLSERGRRVRSLPEDHALPGRKADAEVDGVRTEFKSLTDDPPAGSNTIKNRLNESKNDDGQARDIVIDATATRLSIDEVRRGIGRFLGAGGGHHYDTITVIMRGEWVAWP